MSGEFVDDNPSDIYFAFPSDEIGITPRQMRSERLTGTPSALKMTRKAPQKGECIVRSYIIAAILMTPVLSGLGIAHASPVTYTGQFTASGALGGTTFTDALVTITEFADTSNIGLQSLGTPGIFANIANEATVTIAGISGTATFLDPLGITAATAANTIGVTPSLLMTDLAPLIDSAIFSLRPASPVPTEATLSTDGTTTGPAASVGATFDMYATDHGGLSFLPSTPTGQIVVTAVPEPGSLVLEGIGLGVVSLAALRRRRAYSACQ